MTGNAPVHWGEAGLSASFCSRRGCRRWSNARCQLGRPSGRRGSGCRLVYCQSLPGRSPATEWRGRPLECFGHECPPKAREPEFLGARGPDWFVQAELNVGDAVALRFNGSISVVAPFQVPPGATGAVSGGMCLSTSRRPSRHSPPPMPPHPIDRRYYAEDLVRQDRAGERRRQVSSQRRGRVDPNPHQIDAVMFALRRIPEGGCILADEVGLGKTIEAGLVIAQLLAEGATRILIVVPRPLLGQWQAELVDLFNSEAVEAADPSVDAEGEGVFLAAHHRGAAHSPRAREALDAWRDANGQGARTPSASVAVRLALVDEFRQRSTVLISSEAGAKGLNLPLRCT